MPASTRHSLHKLVAALACALWLLFPPAGYAQDSARQHLAHALKYEDTGKTAEAVIEYKNVLQLDPRNKYARLRLGRLQLRMGDTAAAERNLELAREGGVEVMLDLGRAHLANGAYDRVLEVVQPERAKTRTERVRAWVLRGYAKANRGDAEGARHAFTQALEIDPRDGGALAGLGQLALRDGDPEQIGTALEQDWGAARQDPLMWRIRGALELAAGRYESAVGAFRKALEQAPADSSALLGIATARIAQGRFEAARPPLEKVLAAHPDDSRANLALARIAIGQGHPEDALEPLRKVLAFHPDNREAMLSLAAIRYDLGHTEQARTLLAKYLAAAPDYLPARKLLAMAQMRGGAADQALWGLEPLLGRHPGDVQLLLLAVKAAVLAARPADARVYMDQALASALPARLRPALQQAAAALSNTKPDPDRVVPSLDTLIEDYRRAALEEQLAAATRSLRGGDQGQLEARLHSLEQSPDTRFQGMYLRGLAALTAGQREESRAAMEQMLEADPDYLPARTALGYLDLAAGNWRPARATFEQVLAKDEHNYYAMEGMARAELGSGDTQQAAAWLEKLRRAYPDVPAPRFTLAWHYLRQGRLDLVDPVLGELQQLVAETPAFYDLRGSLRAQRGDYAAALADLRKAARGQSEDVDTLLRLGWVQAATGDNQGARETYGKILAIRPGYIPAAVQWVRLELREKDYRRALRVVKELHLGQPAAASLLEGDVWFAQGKAQRARDAYYRAVDLARELPPAQRDGVVTSVAGRLARLGGDLAQRRRDLDQLRRVAPSHPKVLALQGRIAMAAGDYADAVEVYRQALRQAPGELRWVLHLGQALGFAGRGSEAMELLQGQLKKHPQEPRLHLLLATELLRAGRRREAVDQYRQTLRLEPDNAVALNNAAWLLAATDPAEALDYARRGVALQPSANHLQTLGVVLLRNGKAKEAVEVLRKAVELGPDNGDNRYYLALALQQDDQALEARRLVKKLVSSSAAFKNKAKAEALLRAMEED